MRAAVWVVLLLLVPMTSGAAPDLLPEEYVETGRERLLVLNQGVWTSHDWGTLEEHGIQPLRSVRANALLVWMGSGSSGLPLDVSIEDSPVAQLRTGLDAPTEPGDYKVLLEPRLPSEAVDHVRSTIEGFGLSISSTSLDVGGNLPASLTIHATHVRQLEPLLQTEGVLWIEPVLQTQARNGQASAVLEHGMLDQHPFWSLGLNGSGIVVGVADSGIDADHACFRNATTSTSVHAESAAPYPAVGVFGEEHRKILHMNTAVDGNDTPGHSDYRHGTHVIGSLACHDVESFRQGTVPSNGSTLAHGSRLVVQDIVSSEGWEPPNVDVLLWENSLYGGVVHSNSWGDATTAYTDRTARFDAYARVMPWSLALIAPGNSGEGVLEPANGRNVVAISATMKSLDDGRWSSSSYGPTEAGTDGIFLLAPGANIQSAGADGFWNTNNNNLRLSSGTSMSTPHASGAAAVIQQLYEDGWLVPAFAPMTAHNLNDIQPPWEGAAPLGASVLLGEGFTPSGSLLRASLAMAASPLSEDVRNGGLGGHDLHNPYDGWGALNLSRLFDPSAVEGLGESSTSNIWVHDSYRLASGTVDEWFEANKGQTGDLSGMIDGGAFLNESVGPFLQTGDVFSQRLTLSEGEDVRIRMAFPAQPEPAMVDDLQLRVRLQNGTVLLPDQLLEGSFAPTLYAPNVTDTNNTTVFPPTNETVFGLDIPWSYLAESSYLDVEVVARFVQPGGEEGAVGLDGDAVGFALVVTGVQRDSSEYMDFDGDGVIDKDDACPTVAAPPQFDVDRDGCLDDDDGDGVTNVEDLCPSEAAHPDFDLNQDGCLDDDDGDGVANVEDLCPSEAARPDFDLNQDGCDDGNQWKVSVQFSEGCSGCSVDIRSIHLRVDGFTAYEYDEELGDPLTLEGELENAVWSYVLTQHADGYDMADFTEVELELDLKFVYSDSTTSGRQDWCWLYGNCYTWTPPSVSWRLDVELRNGQQIQSERVVAISTEQYVFEPAFSVHNFTWSKHPTVDVDGDGFTEPGVEYNGVCGVDIPHSYYQPNRGFDYVCDLHRNGVIDAFPDNPSQWVDSDGDGYGDNSSGTEGDAFPNNPGQWSDVDGDGFGDNVRSGGWDDCPYRWGNSTQNLLGCPDADGDGFSDVCGLDWCGAESVWGPNGYSYSRGDTTDSCPSIPGSSYETRYGCPDSDGDGWADPSPASDVGISDACPNEYGKAISKDWRGCPDSDGDGWANVEDDFPHDSEYWLDTDGDGVPDEEDDYPENAFFSSDDEVETLWCCSFCFGIVFLPVFLVKKRKSRKKSVVLNQDDVAHSIYDFGNEVLDEDTILSTEPDNPPSPVLVGNFGDEDK